MATSIRWHSTDYYHSYFAPLGDVASYAKSVAAETIVAHKNSHTMRTPYASASICNLHVLPKAKQKINHYDNLCTTTNNNNSENLHFLQTFLLLLSFVRLWSVSFSLQCEASRDKISQNISGKQQQSAVQIKLKRTTTIRKRRRSEKKKKQNEGNSYFSVSILFALAFHCEYWQCECKCCFSFKFFCSYCNATVSLRTLNFIPWMWIIYLFQKLWASGQLRIIHVHTHTHMTRAVFSSYEICSYAFVCTVCTIMANTIAIIRVTHSTQTTCDWISCRVPHGQPQWPMCVSVCVRAYLHFGLRFKDNNYYLSNELIFTIFIVADNGHKK